MTRGGGRLSNRCGITVKANLVSAATTPTCSCIILRSTYSGQEQRGSGSCAKKPRRVGGKPGSGSGSYGICSQLWYSSSPPYVRHTRGTSNQGTRYTKQDNHSSSIVKSGDIRIVQCPPRIGGEGGGVPRRRSCPDTVIKSNAGLLPSYCRPGGAVRVVEPHHLHAYLWRAPDQLQRGLPTE